MLSYLNSLLDNACNGFCMYWPVFIALMPTFLLFHVILTGASK